MYTALIDLAVESSYYSPKLPTENTQSLWHMALNKATQRHSSFHKSLEAIIKYHHS
jgi:hypothetical protein